MAYTAGFSVNVGDPTKASDVTTLAANDDYLKAAVDGKAALSGSTNNTVATVTGANALIGEADLTFASNKLTVFGTTGTGTATAGVLNLSTRETTVVDADQLGRIDFQAPAETGADAILVTASIYAEADVTFDATNNATDIVLATAHDGAAAERLRITSQGEIGLAGANYGTDGQVLTSAGAGAAAAWETIPPGTTLSGTTDNTVATVTGANALQGEANLTFDGSNLLITRDDTAVTQALEIKQSGTGDPAILFHLTGVQGWYLGIDNSADDTFYINTGSGNTGSGIVVDTSGDVGIGSADPDAAAPTGSSSPKILKIDGGESVDAAIQIVGHSNDHGLDLWTDASTGDAYIDSRGDHDNYDLRFRTKTTGTPVDALMITGNGYLLHGSTSALGSFYSTTANNINGTRIEPTHASYTGDVERGIATRAANSAYAFYQGLSGGGADTEFKLRGDGEAYADGSWNSSGADYQEWFESTDSTELEVGKAVVLDGDKIRIYNAETDLADNILGITRPQADNKNSAVVGNTAWNHWTDKYLTDDWGVYLREDVKVWEWDDVMATESDVVEAVDATYYEEGDDIPDGKSVGDTRTETVEGVAVGDVKIKAGTCYERNALTKDADWTPPEGAVSSTQSERKLNPAYVKPNTTDENEGDDVGYTPRSDRAEWQLIGLLGQVQIKANEPTNPRWIKMKNISDAVELWMIR